jgi:hypothetical protein
MKRGRRRRNPRRNVQEGRQEGAAFPPDSFIVRAGRDLAFYLGPGVAPITTRRDSHCRESAISWLWMIS